MTSALIMGIIGGLLGTLFFNYFFIKQFFRGIYLSFVKPKPDEKIKNTDEKKNFDFMFCGPGKRKVKIFLITQLIFFLLGTSILTSCIYFAVIERTFFGLLSLAYLIGLFHLFNWLIILGLDNDYGIFTSSILPKGLSSSALIFSIGIMIISLSLPIAGSIYEFGHQQESNTYIQEVDVPVISVDTLKTLEKEVIIDGYMLENAIYRNGKIVIPMKRSDNVSFAGYVVIEDNQPRIVPYSLRYTPNHAFSANRPSFIARKHMPTKIFFGDWSFQLKPTDTEDEVYYVCAYGHHKCLRAGRVIEGLAFVNAETGEFSACTLDEVPDWITGISQ